MLTTDSAEIKIAPIILQPANNVISPKYGWLHFI